MSTLIRTWVSPALRRPVLTVVLLALVLRVGAVLALAWLQVEVNPDEQVFWRLATEVRTGQTDGWGAYSEAVYANSRLFVWLLIVGQSVPGTSLLVGQLMAATLGALAAGVTALTGQRLASPTFGLVAGMLVAVWPSQVVFSIPAIRESALWVVLALLGLVAVRAAQAEGRQLLLPGASVAVLVLAAAWLRPTTAVVAALALVLAATSSRRGQRPRRIAGALAILVVVPAIAGLGPTASQLLDAERVEGEQESRSVGSADTACTDLGHAEPATSLRGAVTRTLTTAPHVLAGPLPWQPVCSAFGQLAKVNAIAFVALLALAGFGAWREPRLRSELAFGVWFLLGMLALFSLAQDNVGTTFRHREQIHWVVVLFATAGLGRWWPALRPDSASSTQPKP